MWIRDRLGTVLLILALFGFFVFIYRLCYYHYEYDPQYSPLDYGKYNIPVSYTHLDVYKRQVTRHRAERTAVQ